MLAYCVPCLGKPLPAGGVGHFLGRFFAFFCPSARRRRRLRRKGGGAEWEPAGLCCLFLARSELQVKRETPLRDISTLQACCGKYYDQLPLLPSFWFSRCRTFPKKNEKCQNVTINLFSRKPRLDTVVKSDGACPSSYRSLRRPELQQYGWPQPACVDVGLCFGPPW